MLIPAIIYSFGARSQPKSGIEFWIGQANPEGFGRLPTSLSGMPLNALAPRKPVSGESPYLRTCAVYEMWPERNQRKFATQHRTCNMIVHSIQYVSRVWARDFYALL